MMYFFDIAFGIGLIALALGVSFLMWSYRIVEPCGPRALGKTFGFIISIISILLLAVILYHGSGDWKGKTMMMHGTMMGGDHTTQVTKTVTKK